MNSIKLFEQSNILGAILANIINLSTIFIFLARLAQRPQIENWLGIVFLLSIFPLGYLLYTAYFLKRPFIYFIWIELMILFVIVEFILDYALNLDFRNIQWIVIPYVMLFFGSTGGMIGVAGQAGKKWTIITVISFVIMAILAFAQRHITGM